MARVGKSTRIRVVGGQVEFRFTDPQSTDFIQAVEHYGQKASDWRPIFEEFGPYMLRSIDRNFTAQGRPKRWTKLTPNTIRERLRLGFGRGPILQRTKKLRKGFRWNAGKRTFRIWNTRDYFPHHQFGAPRGNLPARQMVVLLTQDKAVFTRIARKHLRIRP